MRINRNPATVIAIGAFFLCLAVAYFIYWPGLRGAFLFDDYANLPALGEFGPVTNAATFWRYVTSGTADPTGRPVALLSFLIDAHDWPADPFPFKRTAVLLHVLNGALLAWLLLKLGRSLKCPEMQSTAAAILGMALWLLHPLFVSTTLYVVQREAMLPATFILLGLLGYLGSRELAADGHRSGVVLAPLSIGIATIVASLSKANGALLPLLALLIETLILAPYQPIEHVRTKRSFAVLYWLVLILPSALLFAYLAKFAYSGFVQGLPAIRPWTLGERLLTESRILVDYLDLLWLPRPYTAGLFNDGYLVSTGLLSPPTTVFSLLTIVTLITSAWIFRRRHPAFALATLFFFAGQLLESTVVPLELYYEHRNYVPALLMFWPLALWICGNIVNAADATNEAATRPALRGTCFLLILVLPMGLAALTWLRADLWGNTQQQALLWARWNPQSPRAQAYAAQVELEQGHAQAATQRLEHALAKNPVEVQLALNMIGAKCKTSTLAPIDLEHAATALRIAPNTGRLGYDWFERGLAIAQMGSCPGLNLETLDTLLLAAGQNPLTEKVPGRVQDRLHLQGRIALLKGDPQRALEFFNRALDADVRPGAALEQAAILASAGQPALAEKHLDHLILVKNKDSHSEFGMPFLHDWVLSHQGYWKHEIEHMRKLLEDDIVQKQKMQPTQISNP